jgi:hypothetical protein
MSFAGRGLDRWIYGNSGTMSWQQAFGTGARLDGSIGTVSRPSMLEIRVDDRLLGTAGTFQAALADVPLFA